MIFLDLVNLGRDRSSRTLSKGNLNEFSALNEEWMRGVVLSMQSMSPTSLAKQPLPYDLPPSLQMLALFKQEGYFDEF